MGRINLNSNGGGANFLSMRFHDNVFVSLVFISGFFFRLYLKTKYRGEKKFDSFSITIGPISKCLNISVLDLFATVQGNVLCRDIKQR